MERNEIAKEFCKKFSEKQNNHNYSISNVDYYCNDDNRADC